MNKNPTHFKILRKRLYSYRMCVIYFLRIHMPKENDSNSIGNDATFIPLGMPVENKLLFCTE